MPIAPLEPGQDNIDQRKVTGNPKDGYRLQWSVRLYDGRTLKRSITLKGKTKGQVRARAREKTAELLRTSGTKGTWSPASMMGEYIRQASIPYVQSANLRESTKRAYVQKLELMADRLEAYPIADGCRPDTLQEKLNEVAAEHGTATAKQCRKVINKWVIQRLVINNVIDHNPLYGINIDINVEHVAKAKPTGGVALTDGEYRRALDWMLALDPNDPEKTKPKRGRYTQEDLARKRLAVIDMTLLQATTGLRIGECRQLEGRDVSTHDNETWVTVRPEASKTHRGREVPIIDHRVADRINARHQKLTGASDRLFPSQVEENTEWDKSNAQKAITGFLREVSEKCGIPALANHSSHIWRATLSTQAMQRGVPAEIRAAYFGHSAEVNRDYYTDTTDVSGVLNALRQ